MEQIMNSDDHRNGRSSWYQVSLFLVGNVNQISPLWCCCEGLNATRVLEPSMVQSPQPNGARAEIVLLNPVQFPSSDLSGTQGLVQGMMRASDASVGSKHTTTGEHHLVSHGCTKGLPLLKMSCHELNYASKGNLLNEFQLNCTCGVKMTLSRSDDSGQPRSKYVHTTFENPS